MAQDCHQHVNRDRDPDLSSHGVVGVAVKSRDPQVLLDPLEEQLDLPAFSVQLGDAKRREFEVVRDEYQRPVSLGVVERHSPQGSWVIGNALRTGEPYRLIAANTRGSIDRLAFPSGEDVVFLVACHEECCLQMHAIESLEVDIRLVHHVERTALDRQLVQHADFVHFSRGNADKRGDVSA